MLIIKIRNHTEMHIMYWDKVSYEIADYESKHLQIKTSMFCIFGGLHEFNFLKIHIYVHKATLLLFDF